MLSDKENLKKKDKEKDEINYERLFIQVSEMKNEVTNSLQSFIEFFRSFIDNCPSCNTEQIWEMIRTVEKNKTIMKANIASQIKSIIEAQRHRIERIKNINSYLQNYSEISKHMKKGRAKCNMKIFLITNHIDRETNLMNNSEIVSMKYEIFLANEKVQQIQSQANSLEIDIANVKKLNKNLYVTEYNLMEQVMSFDRKIYTVYGERDIKLKQLQQIKLAYAQASDKLDSIRSTQESIVSSHKRRCALLSKKVSELSESTEKSHLVSKTRNIVAFIHKNREQSSLCQDKIPFILLFTEGLKQFLALRKNNLSFLKNKRKELESNISREKCKFDLKLHELFSEISFNFPYIQIDPFSDQDDPNKIMSIILKVNSQLNDKQIFYSAESLNLSKEMLEIKERMKIKKEKLIESAKNKRQFKIVKKAFVLLKCFYRMKKERGARKKANEAENETIKKTKRQKAKEKNNTKIDTTKECCNQVEKLHQVTCNNNIIPSTGINPPIMSQMLMPKKQPDKYSLLIDLPAIEGSIGGNTNTTSTKVNYDNTNFLQELSKNIQEVTHFQPKASFGDKKKKYTHYDFSYI